MYFIKLFLFAEMVFVIKKKNFLSLPSRASYRSIPYPVSLFIGVLYFINLVRI